MLHVPERFAMHASISPITPLVLISAILLTTGCDDQPRKSPAPAEPIPVARPTVFADRWQEPQRHGAIEVDGRNVEVLSIVHESYMNDQLLGTSTAYEVLDHDTGQVILPRQQKRPTTIPGRGLFFFVEEGDFHYPRLDVHSGELVPNSIVAIQDYRVYDRDIADAEAKAQEADPAKAAVIALRLMEPTWVIVTSDPAHDGARVAAILTPAGRSLGTYRDFASMTKVDDFYILCMQHADGSGEQHLLGRFLEHIASDVEDFWLRKPIRAGFDGESRDPASGPRIFGSPAPRTALADDLWVLHGPDGRITTLPGVIGVRPMDCYEWSPTQRARHLRKFEGRDVDRWLVRFAMAGEVDANGQPGTASLAWGLADADLKLLPTPAWKSADLLAAPDIEAYRTRGDWDKGWSRGFLLLQKPNGLWLTCHLFADPTRDPTLLPNYGLRDGLPFHQFFLCWDRPTAQDAIDTTQHLLAVGVANDALRKGGEERAREAKRASDEEDAKRVRQEYADQAAARQRSADNQAALEAVAHDTVTGGYYQAPAENPADAADAAARATYTRDLERYNRGQQNWAPVAPSR